MDDNNGQRRLRSERGGRRQHIEGKIIISWHWRTGSNRATGTDAGGRRASHIGARQAKKGTRTSACPCSTFLFIQDGQLCIKTHCQITTMLLHVSVTTCFSCLVGFVRYSTIQLVDGWGDNLLLELPLCNLSAWTQLSSNIERVKLAWAVCVSWAVAMAPDHTTNGIHSTNYSKTCYTS